MEKLITFKFDENDNLVMTIDKKLLAYGLPMGDANQSAMEILDWDKFKPILLKEAEYAANPEDYKPNFCDVLAGIYEQICEEHTGDGVVRWLDWSDGADYDRWKQLYCTE